MIKIDRLFLKKKSMKGKENEHERIFHEDI